MAIQKVPASSASIQPIYFHLPSVDSTQLWADRNLERFDPNRVTIISADEQTAGYGRRGTAWVSPHSQNIYFSMVYWIDKLPSQPGDILIDIANEVAAVLNEQGYNASVKFPNDVMISGKKVAGCICKTTQHSGKQLMVVGVGLNVNMPKDQLDEIDQPATSLKLERGTTVDRDKLFQMLTARIARKKLRLPPRPVVT